MIDRRPSCIETSHVVPAPLNGVQDYTPARRSGHHARPNQVGGGEVPKWGRR